MPDTITDDACDACDGKDRGFPSAMVDKTRNLRWELWGERKLRFGSTRTARNSSLDE